MAIGKCFKSAVCKQKGKQHYCGRVGWERGCGSIPTCLPVLSIDQLPYTDGVDGKVGC